MRRFVSFACLGLVLMSCTQAEQESTSNPTTIPGSSPQLKSLPKEPSTESATAKAPEQVEGKVVSSAEELRAAFETLQPGDQLLLADGTYENVGDLLLNASGTAEKPITIRPQHPHQVTITGEFNLQISGSHLIIQGLNFVRARNVPTDKSYAGFIGTKNGTTNIRFSGCRFISCETDFTEKNMPKTSLFWMSGNQHRIDHCFFYDPLARAISIKGEKKMMEARIKGEFLVDHNIIRNMDRLRARKTQGEAILLGTGFEHYRTQKLGAVLEYNIFDLANGDMHGEIITVKCSDNSFRHNLFVNCPGAWWEGGSHLCLRTTDNSLVYNNLFQNLGCGLWVTGRNHKIVNNYFIDIDYAGLLFNAGNLTDVVDDKAVIMVDGREIDMKNTPNVYPLLSKEYGAVFMAAENCLIAQNYFGDIKAFAVRAQLEDKKGKGLLGPKNNRIVNNVFEVTVKEDERPLMFFTKPKLNEISHNLYITPEGIQLGEIGENAIMGKPSDFSTGKDGIPRPTADSSAIHAGQPLPGIELLKKDFFAQARDLEKPTDIGAAKYTPQLGDLRAKLPPVPPMPGSLKDKPLRASFKPFASSVQAGEYLMLDAATSAGEIATYTWNFGDGNTAKVEGNAIAHQWKKPGSYEVMLTVFNQKGEQSRVSHTIAVK